MEITPKLHQNMYGIIQKLFRMHQEFIQNTSRMQFYYYVCKIYASYTKLISHYALININIGHYSLVTDTNSIKILMSKIFFWERIFNKNLVLNNKKKFFVLSILLILNLYPHKICTILIIILLLRGCKLMLGPINLHKFWNIKIASQRNISVSVSVSVSV